MCCVHGGRVAFEHELETPGSLANYMCNQRSRICAADDLGTRVRGTDNRDRYTHPGLMLQQKLKEAGDASRPAAVDKKRESTEAQRQGEKKHTTLQTS